MDFFEKIRKVENLHIIFWLLKDMSWCMLWKELGVIMIIPTVSVSFYLIYFTRKNLTEFYHNIAVFCWILANSYWMISEFFGFDEHYINSFIQWKTLSIIPFGTGVLILAWYYLFVKKRKQLDNLG